MESTISRAVPGYLTQTGVPIGVRLYIHLASGAGIRMQPCEAG
jgi:hypothetical protein